MAVPIDMSLTLAHMSLRGTEELTTNMKIPVTSALKFSLFMDKLCPNIVLQCMYFSKEKDSLKVTVTYFSFLTAARGSGLVSL